MTRSADEKKSQSVPMNTTPDLEWARAAVAALLARLIKQAKAKARK